MEVHRRGARDPRGRYRLNPAPDTPTKRKLTADARRAAQIHVVPEPAREGAQGGRADAVDAAVDLRPSALPPSIFNVPAFPRRSTRRGTRRAARRRGATRVVGRLDAFDSTLAATTRRARAAHAAAARAARSCSGRNGRRRADAASSSPSRPAPASLLLKAVPGLAKNGLVRPRVDGAGARTADTPARAAAAPYSIGCSRASSASSLAWRYPGGCVCTTSHVSCGLKGDKWCTLGTSRRRASRAEARRR